MLLVFIFLLFITAILTLKIKLFIQVKEKKSEVIIKFYIFKILPIGKINTKKINKRFNNAINIKIKNKIKLINTREIIKIIIKYSNLHLEYLKLKLDICLAEAVLTSYSVAILSSFIALLIKQLDIHVNHKNFFYKVTPIYTDEIIMNIEIKCIISTNLVHIITIICKSIKEWRREDNGRKPSNRRAYGNCYE